MLYDQKHLHSHLGKVVELNFYKIKRVVWGLKKVSGFLFYI